MLGLVVLGTILSLSIVNAGVITPRMSISNRIVGGDTVNIESLPYQVSLNFFGQHLCGGSIISENFILTAAHCTPFIDAAYLQYFTVRSGSNYSETDGDVHKVKRIHQHVLFDDATMDYDFCILELEDPITFSSTQRPIQLADAETVITPGDLLKTSGWGDTKDLNESNYHIRAVTVPLTSQSECAETFGLSEIEITDRMLCAGYSEGGKDACQGDSGGPIVTWNNVLVGVVSWGNDCALPDFPGVYSKVASVREWINSIADV
ncbi:hypothetical protein DMENIID0001_104970 [Sergentomyia squamirostris]